MHTLLFITLSLDSLLDRLFNAIVSGFGWRIGTHLADSMPVAGAIVLVAVLVLRFWWKSRRRTRRREDA